ncbi:methyl-accepting chemotaxis protein [Desulfotomaculum sp. 1211_IL3151]|uniref:methyl-accepting chemotaxis protein n=1 Tax=Desulfotomaculum sp. 1211_IL3151 TaxID=3084055 RepID=UPI002FDAC0A5
MAKKSIKFQLLGIVILVLIMAITATGYEAYRMVNEATDTSVVEKAKGDLALGEAFIEQAFPGPWRVEGDQLYKGTTLMNHNDDIVDKIGQLTNDTCTIFLNDQRVATNVKKEDGTRAVGTKASQEVIDTVIKQKQPYYGEANVVGVIYQTAYKPIYDQANNVIGMFYVGVSKQFVDGMLNKALRNICLISFVILGISIVIILWRINKTVIQPINKLKSGSTAISEGDLNQEITVTVHNELGELANNFNKMAANLKQVIRKLAVNSFDLAGKSQELVAVSEEVNATIESMASNSTEVVAITEQSAAGSRLAATDMDGINDKAQRGNQSAQNSIEQMNTLKQTVNTSVESVKILHDHSQNIGKIIEVITQIADQTNLLALNAAIEAARAGDNGRGFAVVAEEVRKLAAQSANAAKEIKDLIVRIQRRVEGVLEIMQRSEEEVAKVTGVILTTGNAFAEISLGVANSSGSISQIATGAEQISKSTQDLAGSSQQMSAIVQQVTVSATAMSKMAEELNEMVRIFKV